MASGSESAFQPVAEPPDLGSRARGPRIPCLAISDLMAASYVHSSWWIIPHGEIWLWQRSQAIGCQTAANSRRKTSLYEMLKLSNEAQPATGQTPAVLAMANAGVADLAVDSGSQEWLDRRWFRRLCLLARRWDAGLVADRERRVVAGSPITYQMLCLRQTQ